MKVTALGLSEVKLLEPKVLSDPRGHFLEVWRTDALAELGLTNSFVQENHSRSAKGVLRGLHYQRTRPQGKLVRVVAGRAFDVAVDIRPRSETFGQHVAVELTAMHGAMVWIPPGFAHGFLALEDDTDVIYTCTQLYAAEYDRAIRWNDPDLSIDWPLNGAAPILSVKDRSAPALRIAELD